MTVDELITLTEAILRHVTVRDIRTGLSEVSLDGLEDSDWAVLMRFVAGERPMYDRPYEPVGRTALREARRHLPKDRITLDPDGYPTEDDDDIEPVRPQERTSSKPLELSGDFDGVVLP